MFNGLDGRRESDWPDAESKCEQVESASENLPTNGSGDSDFPTGAGNFLRVANDVAMHLN
jgi:hypothetical protein